MDRSAQIIFYLIFLLFGGTASAQKSPKQGLKSYPIYYLQKLGFEQSRGIGIYSWVDPADRNAVFQTDTLSEVPSMDTLVILSQVEHVINPQIDTIPYRLSKDDLKPDVGQQSPDSLLLEIETPPVLLVDSASLLIVRIDTLPEIIQEPMSKDTIFISESESDLSNEIVDSLGHLAQAVDSIPIIQTNDPVIEPTDSFVQKDLSSDEIVLPEKGDNITSDANTRSELLRIRSDSNLFSEDRMGQVVFDSRIKKRPMLESSSADTISSVKIEEKTKVIQTTETQNTERTIEKPIDYTGQYAGLSKAERERQLRLDAEIAGKIQRQQLTSENTTLELERDPFFIEKSVENDSVHVSENSEQKNATSVISDSPTIITHGQFVPQTVIINRDTVTEGLLENISKRLTEISLRDSIERLQFQSERQEEIKKIETRFNRIESKVDTLLSKMTGIPVKESPEFKTMIGEMSVYFSVNSHSISDSQRLDLAQYISQVNREDKFQIVLSGFADNSGNKAYNELLVAKRIEAVKLAILDIGIQPAEIVINNFGKQKANTSKTYNQVDRKVVVQILLEEN